MTAPFFGMLLEAAQHERPDSGTVLQRRLRLYHKLTDLVEWAAGNKLIVFVDEAQRLSSDTTNDCGTCRTNSNVGACGCSHSSSVNLVS